MLMNTIFLWPVMLFFCWFMYDAMKRVPEEQQRFPAWFVWMMLIPLVGYIFMWMMLPFGIPRSFERATEGDLEAKKSSRKLFGFGLAWVILCFFWALPPCFIAIIVLMILYWIEVSQFKKQFLLKE